MNIAYCPAGDRGLASSRLRVYKIADALKAQGHSVQFSSPGILLHHAEVCVYQKRFDCKSQMSLQAIQCGSKVIFDCDDLLAGIPFQSAWKITTDTQYKKDIWVEDAMCDTQRIAVVPDALDIDGSSPRKSAHAEKLQRVVYVGNPENTHHLHNVWAACRELSIELVVITDLESRELARLDDVIWVQWELDTVDQHIIQADVMVCPYTFEAGGIHWAKSKSANRLLKGWALGMPVIGTPIPSYVDVGLQYCATTVDEWKIALGSLMSRESRQCDAERGYEIAQQFTAEKVAMKWLEAFEVTK